MNNKVRSVGMSRKQQDLWQDNLTNNLYGSYILSPSFLYCVIGYFQLFRNNLFSSWSHIIFQTPKLSFLLLVKFYLHPLNKTLLGRNAYTVAFPTQFQSLALISSPLIVSHKNFTYFSFYGRDFIVVFLVFYVHVHHRSRSKEIKNRQPFLKLYWSSHI
jgi:hypothetical protein